MANFHKPRVSTIALEKACNIVRQQSAAKSRVEGQIFGLPIYHGKPAASMSEIADEAQRAGWRYLFVADKEGARSDAVIDFGKTSSGKPYLKSFAHSRLPRKMIDRLKGFEEAQKKDNRSYYLQFLIVHALNFEMLWFKDAARKNPEDSFRAITPDYYSGVLETEIEARYTAALGTSRPS